MRRVNWVILHCSDSDVPAHDDIKVVAEWHMKPLIPPLVEKAIIECRLPTTERFKYGRGFKKIGYHYFITKDGVVHEGRKESEVGAHAQGHNSDSIGICLSGKTKFTSHQFASLGKLLKEVCRRYNLKKEDIVGHCDLNGGKTCPNFNVAEFLSKLDF